MLATDHVVKKVRATIMGNDQNVLFSKGEVPSQLLGELWTEALDRGGDFCLQVVSGSMRPFIQPDERIIVKRVDVDRVRLGDIVVYKSRGRLVTHRIIGKMRANGKLCFLQKGDSSWKAEFISSCDVLAKVIAIRKEGKTLRLDTTQGRIANYILALCHYLRYRSVALRRLLCAGRANRFSNLCFRLVIAPLSLSQRLLSLFFERF